MAADQHKVWESIAASFDRTRQRVWPHVADFVAGLPPKSRVLDLMAGNGRHSKLLLEAGHDAVCVDWSRPATLLIHQRHPDAQVIAADATQLPLSDQVVDACIYVAGLHSIPSAEGRLASLHELHRVLRPDGTAQITVWSRNAPKFRSLDLPAGPVDIELPWKADGHDATRFYHLYDHASLQAVLATAHFELTSIDEVAVTAPQPDNLVAIVRRKA